MFVDLGLVVSYFGFVGFGLVGACCLVGLGWAFVDNFGCTFF